MKHSSTSAAVDGRGATAATIYAIVHLALSVMLGCTADPQDAPLECTESSWL